MSEQRKRLTDADVERVWDEQFDEPEAHDRMVRIQADHLQARKDRTRLAGAIREAIRIGAVETPRTFELILAEMGL